MNSRLQNAKKYAVNGAFITMPCGMLASGIVMGCYYAAQYINYSTEKLADLSIENGCGFGTNGAICPGRDELENRINEQAAHYGTTHARADLATTFPIIVAPLMFGGMIIGGVYGFLLSPQHEAQPLLNQSKHFISSNNDIVNQDGDQPIGDSTAITIKEVDTNEQFTDPLEMEVIGDNNRVPSHLERLSLFARNLFYPNSHQEELTLKLSGTTITKYTK